MYDRSQPDLLAIGRENALRLMKLDRPPHNLKPGLTMAQLEIGGLSKWSLELTCIKFVLTWSCRRTHLSRRGESSQDEDEVE